MEIKMSVFATSNNAEKITEPLRSRFFIVKLQACTFEQPVSRLKYPADYLAAWQLLLLCMVQDMEGGAGVS
jgi:hypothetical protein